MRSTLVALLLLSTVCCLPARASDDCAARIRDLARFESEEVQKPGQPLSVRAGLREDLQRKVAELARLSGVSESQVRALILAAKRQRLFGPTPASVPVPASADGIIATGTANGQVSIWSLPCLD